MSNRSDYPLALREHEWCISHQPKRDNGMPARIAESALMDGMTTISNSLGDEGALLDSEVCLHPIATNTRVVVYGTSAGRCDFVEGWARILGGVGRQLDVYVLQFEGEALPQIRQVLVEWQMDPAVRLIAKSA